MSRWTGDLARDLAAAFPGPATLSSKAVPPPNCDATWCFCEQAAEGRGMELGRISWQKAFLFSLRGQSLELQGTFDVRRKGHRRPRETGGQLDIAAQSHTLKLLLQCVIR